MTISLLCALCGGETAVDMEHFGQMKEDFLREFLELPHGVPCHDAYSRLFRLMKPTSLQAFFDRAPRFLEYAYGGLAVTHKFVWRIDSPSGLGLALEDTIMIRHVAPND